MVIKNLKQKQLSKKKKLTKIRLLKKKKMLLQLVPLHIKELINKKLKIKIIVKKMMINQNKLLEY